MVGQEGIHFGIYKVGPAVSGGDGMAKNKGLNLVRMERLTPLKRAC